MGVQGELFHMSFKPAVLGLLAAACVTAAAGGAFLAVRQNTTPSVSVTGCGAEGVAAAGAECSGAPSAMTDRSVVF